MARVRKKSAVPVYAVAFTWAFWASVFPMYKISHFVILTILSFLVYKTTSVFFRGKWVEVAEPEPVYESSGNREVDALVSEGRQSIKRMRELNAQIQDKKISQQINRLEQLSNEIFAQVTKNPAKLPQIRKFMSVRGKNIPLPCKRLKALWIRLSLPLKNSWTVCLVQKHWISLQILRY